MATNPLMDPWAWQARAAQENPELNGWKMRGIGPAEAQILQGYLEQAGLWKPEYDTWSNVNPENPIMGAADYGALAPYSFGTARANDNVQLNGLFGPGGQMLGGYADLVDKSWKGKDWGNAAFAVAAPIAAGYGSQYLMDGGASGVGGVDAYGAGSGWGADTLSAMGADGVGSAAGGSLTGGVGLSGGVSGYGGLGQTAALAGGTGGGAGGGLGGALTSNYGLGQLGSAAIGLYGNQKAIGAYQDATNAATGLQQQALDYTKELNAPLVGLRNSVLPRINALLQDPSSITQEPGYQFGLKQGADQLNNRAAASGNYYSGGQMKAAQRYGQDYAGTKLDQSLNRLTTVAGLGQVGANNAQQGVTQGLGSMAGNVLNLGNARGSLYGGNAQIVGNALGSIFNDNQYRSIWGNP